MNTNYLFFAILIFIVLFIIFRFFLSDYKNYKYSNPIIIPNTISIDSSEFSYPAKKIFRSIDQKHGLEYTYAFWLNINNVTSTGSNPDNVFVKGMKSGTIPTISTPTPTPTPACYSDYTIQGPGVWVQKDGHQAQLVIATNTYIPQNCSSSSYKTQEDCPLDYCNWVSDSGTCVQQ